MIDIRVIRTMIIIKTIDCRLTTVYINKSKFIFHSIASEVQLKMSTRFSFNFLSGQSRVVAVAAWIRNIYARAARVYLRGFGLK